MACKPRKYFKIFLLIIFCTKFVDAATSVKLEPGYPAKLVLSEIGSFGYAVKRMNIFCFHGRDKKLSSFLNSVKLKIDIEDDEKFNCYIGSSEEEVENAHKDHKSLFSFNILSATKKRVMNLNPFNKTCVGIEASEEYKVSLDFLKLDILKLSLLLFGILTFFLAEKLSRNTMFFYLSGISVGNLASVVVLVWFISKLFPKKPIMYGVLASGWTLIVYFAQIISDNVQSILVTYQKYVAIYVLTSSIIAFAVCYYKGPPKNVRSINLIKWALQATALVAIFFSSEFREASLGIITACILIYHFPGNTFAGIKRMWRKRYLPKRRLLTREEFEEEGRIETEKALKNLREFVKSPQCKDQWKLVMNLSQPTRFASFVEGDSHLTRDETMNYDDWMTMDLSDDEEVDLETESDEGSTIDESIAFDENFKKIDKSKISKYNNKSISRIQNYDKTPKVSSSTPKSRYNGRSPAIQKNKKSYVEISDDE